MNRKLSPRLPSTEPLVGEDHNTEARKKKYELRQKKNHDRSATPLLPVQENDIVGVRSGCAWGPKAKVLKEKSPRSYKVEIEQGTVLRCNRRHLLGDTSETGPGIRTENTAQNVETCGWDSNPDNEIHGDESTQVTKDALCKQKKLPGSLRVGWFIDQKD